MTAIQEQRHHNGLYLLFFVEMWERFSYYGMRALILLYMIQSLSYTIKSAGIIYGFYTGLVYLTPLAGGYIADKYLGQRKCIKTGAFLMCIGLFLLTTGIKEIFLFALFLMIAANGFFKSNISSLLGLLYENESELKDSAYTIFYMGINIGALMSPLVCGTLAIKFGYEYGFAAAGFGMLLGLVLYIFLENKLLGDNGIRPIRKEELCDNSRNKIGKKQKYRLYALFVLMLLTIPFWICFEQAGSSLTLFAQYNTNRHIGGFEIPTGYFQALNPLFIIILAPIMSCIWNFLRQKSKEPASVEKFAIALMLMSVSFFIMTIAGHFAQTAQVSFFWLVICYFIMTVAELCLSPIGLSLVSKLAPKEFLSLCMGCWFLTSFFGNFLAGFWGGKYGTLSLVILFGTLCILSFITSIILVYVKPHLSRILK